MARGECQCHAWVVQAQHPTQCQKQGDLPAKEGRLRTPLFLWEVCGLAFWCTGSWLQEIGMGVCEDVMVEVEEGVC